MASRRAARPGLWLGAACLLGLFAWLLGDALWRGENFVFRDTAHFYYPQFKYAQGQWGGGPLWNPLENAGQPLAAMGTSSVYYPGKLLLALPPSFDAGLRLYVLGHLLLAAGGAFLLARRFGYSDSASALCGMAYAFGGSVLFQYCNVPYLVGAAWLPLAALHAERAMRRRSAASAAWLAVVLALMVLGGDPQMAYHVGLAAALYAWLLRREQRRQAAEPPDADAGRIGFLRHRLVLLGLAAGLGLGLSAVQVLPSWRLSKQSERAVYAAPRSIYEVPGYALRDAAARGPQPWYAGLLNKPRDGRAHEALAGQFSLGPWRLAELAWPNVGGRQSPVHRRWLEVFPAEGRVWVPSLYMGAWTLVLALAGFHLRRCETRVRWVSWLVLFSVLAAFGSYGPGRLSREWFGDPAAPGAWPVGDGFGGLYWLMKVALPGYVRFRYPAKLFVLAALGLSVLAARGWDELAAGRAARRATVFTAGLLALSMIGIATALLVAPVWADWLQAAPADTLLGPLEADGAWWDLLTAFVQAAAVLAAGWWLCLRLRRSGARWPAAALLVLCAVDLGLANRWLVATAPAEQWHATSKAAEVIRRDAARRGLRFYRVDRPYTWYPDTWEHTSSQRRQQVGMAWDRDTLMPKYNLLAGIPLLETQATMRRHDYGAFLDGVARSGGDEGKPGKHSRGLDLLNVAYLVLPTGVRPPGASRWQAVDDGGLLADVEDVRIWFNPRAMPRAWVVHDVEFLPPIGEDSPAEVARRTERVLFPGGRPRDLLVEATVEAAAPVDLPRGDDFAAPDERCELTSYAPEKVVLDVELRSGGLLVLADAYDPDWSAEVSTDGGPPQAAPVLRTNRVLRGVVLPPGVHRVVLRYRPWTFSAGLAISLASLAALLLAAALAWRLAARERKRR